MTPSTAEQFVFTLNLSKINVTDPYIYQVYFDTTGDGTNGIVWIDSIVYGK